MSIECLIFGGSNHKPSTALHVTRQVLLTLGLAALGTLLALCIVLIGMGTC